MVAEAEVVCQQSVPVLEVPIFGKGSKVEEIDEIFAIPSPVSSPEFRQVGRGATESVSVDLSTSQLVRLFIFPVFFFNMFVNNLNFDEFRLASYN